MIKMAPRGCNSLLRYVGGHCGVECINQGLSTLAVGSGDSRCAVVDGDGVRIARVDELIANKLGDDVGVQSRSMREVTAHRGERILSTAVKDPKCDLGNGTLVKVGVISESRGTGTSTGRS